MRSSKADKSYRLSGGGLVGAEAFVSRATGVAVETEHPKTGREAPETKGPVETNPLRVRAPVIVDVVDGQEQHLPFATACTDSSAVGLKGLPAKLVSFLSTLLASGVPVLVPVSPKDCPAMIAPEPLGLPLPPTSSTQPPCPPGGDSFIHTSSLPRIGGFVNA